ncbi:type II secretion system protein [Patescibacteria group bacterium]|nr:type II secretion system protein [Patescibacteria group bacterium]
MPISLKKAGFTLIELMVVVAIIGILMAAGILAFSNAQQNARDSRRRADIDAISKALEQYYANNSSSYPATAGAINSYFPAGVSPSDPQGGAYDMSLSTSAYCVCAELEKADRGNATAVGTAGVCTYGTGSGADYFCASQRQ